jgi:hypothetical protein
MAAPTAPAAFPRRPLAAWTYADAVAAVQWAAQQRLSAADYNANERYLAGDHWQDGARRGSARAAPTRRGPR